MLEDSFEEIKLTFSKNAIPCATTEEGICQNMNQQLFVQFCIAKEQHQ